MPKVSNVTNSNDPQMINARVFVGNLNTFAVSNEDVERLFKRYGRIYGISMHKGYAFVQFCNEYDARNAVAGEEGRVVAGQALDVNLVSEPKANRPTRKRPADGAAAGVAAWDYFYDSHGPPHPAPMHGLMKRPRSDALTVRRELIPVRPKIKGQPFRRPPVKITGPFIQYNVPDVVICGNCKEQFANLDGMLTHRKTRCKLRFACKCQQLAEKDIDAGPFHCSSCQEICPSLWEAAFHSQNIHNVQLVVEQLKEKKEEPDNDIGAAGDGSGNHEGETSGDIVETENTEAEGGFENDGNGDGEEGGDVGGTEEAAIMLEETDVSESIE